MQLIENVSYLWDCLDQKKTADVPAKAAACSLMLESSPPLSAPFPFKSSVTAPPVTYYFCRFVSTAAPSIDQRHVLKSFACLLYRLCQQFAVSERAALLFTSMSVFSRSINKNSEKKKISSKLHLEDLNGGVWILVGV